VRSPEPPAGAAFKDRARGAFLGLAVGDAVGMAVEFKPRGSFPPLTDMIGGGPFNLAAGQWTDDTSMALCLAASLADTGRFDPRDQMERYLRWRRHGYMSVTGRCFDIGATTAAALRRFEETGEPVAGCTARSAAGNGSLMRLAPAVLFFARDTTQAEHYAAESSRTTHAAPQAVDACRLFARLLLRALSGQPRDQILAPAPGPWDDEIAPIAAALYRDSPEHAISSSGYVVHSLEAALWCFHRAASFRDGCLMAANLGGDADTVAAIYGQIAGAHWGESGIPCEWLEMLAWADRIRNLADRLIAVV
jgi:ADP-ribosyl-[dinitrogen reductase] hydrolase